MNGCTLTSLITGDGICILSDGGDDGVGNGYGDEDDVVEMMVVVMEMMVVMR